MKNFSWNYFCNTGNIESYLLFKEFEVMNNPKEEEIDEELD